MFNRGGLYYHHLNYDNSRDEDFYPHLIDIERLSRLLNWKTIMKFVFSELSTEKASLSLCWSSEIILLTGERRKGESQTDI